MRGNQDFQGAMFSYISLEERVPAAHPLRKLRAVVDALLATMNREFDAVYARRGRPSVPPEMLLKALLLQILFSIRSERQLVEAVNYNLLYRWFVGLNIEDKVWDHSTFSANRERLFNEDLARAFFERVKLSAQWGQACQRRTLQRGRHADRGLGLAQEFQAQRRRQPRRPGAIPRWTSKDRSAATTPTPAPRTPMPACSRRARATSPACATWGTSSWRTATG
jgi:transposase